MQIIFLRHGIAAERLPPQTDADRPLTLEGISQATRITAELAKLLDDSAVILTSPKIRARQTAELLGKRLKVKPTIVEALGNGRAKDVIEVLAERGEGCVVVVGHEPDLSEAVEMMLLGRTEGRIELEKAGSASVRVTGPIRWGQACGILQWLTVPTLWE